MTNQRSEASILTLFSFSNCNVYGNHLGAHWMVPGWSSRVCIFNVLPGGTDAGLHFQKHRERKWSAPQAFSASRILSLQPKLNSQGCRLQGAACWVRCEPSEWAQWGRAQLMASLSCSNCSRPEPITDCLVGFPGFVDFGVTICLRRRNHCVRCWESIRGREVKSIKPPSAQDPSDPSSLFPLLGIFRAVGWISKFPKFKCGKSQLISCVFFLKKYRLILNLASSKLCSTVIMIVDTHCSIFRSVSRLPGPVLMPDTEGICQGKLTN